MTLPIRKVQTQQEKVIDYQYIRNLKNKEVRKSRFKRTLSQRIFRIFLILVLLSEIAYLGFHGFRALQDSSLFVLNDVQVTGTHKMTVEEVKKIVLAKKSNALRADLTEIKLRLENHPWIQSAILWRELPGTIHVHVTERKPAALMLSGDLYLVDHSGRIIQLFDQDPQFAGLPVITGIASPSDQENIRSGLEFLDLLSGDPEVLKKVSEIHYYDRDSTTIYLNGMPFGLLVSKDGILPMIRKFLSYMDFVKNNFSGQKIIDLRYKDQIVLKSAYQEQL